MYVNIEKKALGSWMKCMRDCNVKSSNQTLPKFFYEVWKNIRSICMLSHWKDK